MQNVLDGLVMDRGDVLCPVQLSPPHDLLVGEDLADVGVVGALVIG
jgi:hypothetical protein